MANRGGSGALKTAMRHIAPVGALEPRPAPGLQDLPQWAADPPSSLGCYDDPGVRGPLGAGPASVLDRCAFASCPPDRTTGQSLSPQARTAQCNGVLGCLIDTTELNVTHLKM